MTPEHDLIVAVIRSGIKDKDIAYFDSDEFKRHCDIIGSDHKIVYLQAMHQIKNVV